MGKLIVVVTRFLSLCAVLLAALLPASAIAADVVLQPNQGPVGTGVTATGTGWSPGIGVLIYLESQQIGGPVTTDASGAFTTTFCIPDMPARQPGVYPVFFTNGRENFNPPFSITAGTPGNCQASTSCADAYFIGVHGVNEGPDIQNPDHGLSPVISETWDNFYSFATNLGKNVTGYTLDYDGSVQNLFAGAVDPAVERLDTYIRGQVIRNCPTQRIVLVGYSLGAWIIDDWLSRPENKPLWPNIVAVELYGPIAALLQRSAT